MCKHWMQIELMQLQISGESATLRDMSVAVDAVSVDPMAAGTPVAHATPYGAGAAAVVVAAGEAQPQARAEDGKAQDGKAKPEAGEARTRAEADDVVTAWRAISACHARTCALLERELGERHGLGVSDYEVLARLAESDQHKYRAQDLADAVHLSQSALSRLVDRLARHGLVQRFTCDMDRRGIYVQLTEEGQLRYAQAQPTHLDILRRTLPGDLIGQ